MTVARSIAISRIGMTPNPVGVGSAYLIEADVSEVANPWSSWASSTWGDLADTKWGS